MTDTDAAIDGGRVETLWTSDDSTGTYAEGQLLESWIPGSKLVLVQGAGHWPQWELPDEFDRLHFEFLQAS
jgi:2-hydroxy-6-oxonona-2,4-dienedioate hydrolase